MQLTENHTSIKNCPKIIKLCQPLIDNSPIRFFIYSRVFDDGYTIDFAINKDWQAYFYSKNYHLSPTNERLKQGINYWRKNKKSALTEIAEDAKKNFDIDNKIDFISRGENFFDLFGFGSSKKLSNKANSFYDYHQSELLKFIAFFKHKTSYWVDEHLNDKILLPNYKTPEYLVKRNFNDEIGVNNLNLTSKEFLCLLLYGNGYTAKQIAEMLNKSSRTIIFHVNNVKYKTNCKDKQSMNAYIRENAWDCLVDFFLPISQVWFILRLKYNQINYFRAGEILPTL